ncbi:50S ribosomal protein L13 [Myxococcota bacterium]|nr:50S ribosomal protein L13 [Myxococcota bacterium]
MSTTIARSESVERSWYVIDATGQTLGRLSTRIATALRGKHKTDFTPHVDCGDYVIVVNADKVALTGRKLDQKEYYAYTGYPGGLKTRTARQLLVENPERIIQHAVKGMLPKNRLSRQVMGKLKIYAGPEHPHVAQQPQPFPAHI